MEQYNARYDEKTGRPTDKTYLEMGLPPFLSEAVAQMSKALKKINAGEPCLDWDGDYCELQSSINVAEVENMISSEQAWFLREKYLGIKRQENTL